MNRPERTSRRFGVNPLVVVIVCTVLMAVVVYLVLDAHPLSIAGRFDTLEKVCVQKIPVRRAFEIMARDDRFLVVEYEVAMGGLQSGPPAAVFTRDGRRVAYSDDIGDDPTFTERWYKSENMQEVADVCAWLQGG